MRWMNRWDVDEAMRRFDPSVTPNRAYIARVVETIRDYADTHSDGWAYWRKPVNACAKAFELIDGGTTPERWHQEELDATDDEVKAALRPIKAFLTRQGERHENVLPARQLGLAFR